MNLRIDEYSFGRIVVGGREFTSDLILHPDCCIQDKWRRSHGHNLLPGDIISVLDVTPENLIIGTGAYGRMKVSKSVIELCRNHGIAIDMCNTSKAVERFNKAVGAGKTFAACFHLTC